MQQISQVDVVFRDFRPASKSYWRVIQLPSKFSELSITTIKRGARLAVGRIVMLDERGKFRELILELGRPRAVRAPIVPMDQRNALVVDEVR